MSAAGGSVFDRLYDVNSYTGVYAERFRSGPGINAATGDARASMHGVSSFRGYPNEGTDEVIRDISHITRPHFNKSAQSSPAGRRTRTGRRGEPSAPESSELPVFPLDANAQLQLVFQYYCKFGRTGGKGESEDSIDNVNFSKFARECPGLLDGFLDRTEIDLIFTKCKSKGARRLSYSQFLDALSAMAAAKYRDEDPATAFSMLLAHHVFHAPPALGVQAAMAKRQQAAMATRHAGGASYASRPGTARSGAGPRASDRDGYGQAMGGKEAERGDGRAHPHAGAGGDGDFSYGRSPAIDQGHGHGRGGAAYGPGPAQSMGGSMASYGGGGGDPAPGAFDGSATLDSVRGAGATLGRSPTLHDPPVPASARRRAQTRKELLFSPGRSARRDMARAERAQAAEQRTQSQGTVGGGGGGTRRPMGYGHGVPPPPLPQGALGGGKVVAPGVTRHMDPRVAAFEADPSATGHTGAYGSPAASRRPVSAPGMGGAGPGAAGGPGGGGAGGPTLPSAGVSAVPTAAAVPMGAPRGLRMASGIDPTMGGPPQGLGYGQTPGGAPVGTGYYDDIDVDYSKGGGSSSTGGAGGSTGGMRGVPGYRHDHHPLAGPLVADIHGAPQPVHMTKEGLYPAIRRGQSFRDAPPPMRYDPSAQIAQARRRGQEGRAAMARSARGRSHAKFGSPYYTPTLAGEANKPRSVWDRLSQPSSFTGVYKRAYFTDGRMNAFADTGVSAIPTEFTGDTNTQSNETVHDISVMLRPNLKNGKTFR